MRHRWILLAALCWAIGLPAVAADNQLTDAERRDGWQLLFDGSSLKGWKTSSDQPSKRPVENDSLNPHRCGGYMLIHEKTWDNFTLSLDFKISPHCNSGVFVRTWPLEPRPGKDVGFNGIEVAVDDTRGAGFHDTGALYDLVAPKENAMRAVGEWNHLQVTCDKNLIEVRLNDKDVTKMDLDQWTEKNKRPDGTPHKFDIAFKDHPRSGYIGLQDHGADCWYKNIKVRPLSKPAEKPGGARSDAVPAIGAKAAEFTFKDIRYLPRTLRDLGEKKAYVLAFTTLDCPIVQRYLPRVKELEEAYRDRGVQFVSVNVGADDPIAEVAWQAVRSDCQFPFVQDSDGSAARALGASRTPQVVVLDSQRAIRYRGRIDNQFRLGGVRPDPGREDLKEALEDLLAGREVAVAETPVDGCRISLPVERPPAASVTFADHVAPLLAKHCQECHRVDGDAPFALVSFDDATAHAETIAEVVADRRMPPWYASGAHGAFVNRRGLAADERRTIVDWVRGGQAPGDLAKVHQPPANPAGRWRIGTPDLVLRAPQPVKLPATGYMPYQYAILPYVFTHDTWVQGVQILPENPRALHHCNMAYVKIGGGFGDGNFITGQVPGGEAMMLQGGVGFLIPAGTVLGLQMHYVPTGVAATDRISVGLVYAKEQIDKRLRHVVAKNLSLTIPPNAPHHRVAASTTMPADATGVGMFAHMHLRGKDITFLAHHGDGSTETLLAVPNYSFDWQMPYRWEPGKQQFPKGTRIECVAHYDNSAFNPYNPDPSKTVEEGQQTYQEMMYGFLFYTLDAERLNLTIDPKTGHTVAAQAAK